MPLSAALFNDCGVLRKHTILELLHKLAVSSENTNEPDVDVIDGNEMYKITWLKTGTSSAELHSAHKSIQY